jgi:hypothetical protein
MNKNPAETDIQISFVGADEATADRLRAVFTEDDEDVEFAHAFGGADVVTILTKSAKPIIALVQYLTKSGKEITAKGNQITAKGYSAQDILTLCASPDFRAVFRPSAQK